MSLEMPRRRKSFTSKKRSRSAPASIRLLTRRPAKRKQWSEESMTAALKAVEQGMPVSRASRDFGVPRSTIYDRFTGRVVHGVKPGPKPYLDQSEEEELGKYLKHCAKLGYGKTRKDVLSIVESTTTERGTLRSSHVSDGWWRRFKERHGDLSLRQGDNTAHVRMDAMNQDTVDHYFALLHDTLKNHGLLDKPSQIYNVDESGVPLNPRPPKVVASKGRVTKKVRYRTSGRKGQITVVGCANASGQAIPPMIIFDAAKLNPSWTKDEVPGTKYGLSSNGWINSDLFEGWFVEHFLENAVSARPLFLLLDGHSTHYQPQVIRLALEHNCIVLCLPPHTTHESQPLDVGVFAPLKVQWTQICHEFYQKNPGRIITKFNFCRLFSQAWCQAVTPKNIMAGFRRAGVYPYNPKAIAISESTGSDLPSTSISADSSHSVTNAVTDDTVTDDTTTTPVTTLPSGGAESSTSASNSIGETSNTLHVLPSITSTDETSDTLSHSSISIDALSADMVELFKRRYEEGFDLPDPVYQEWLKLHYPESLQATATLPTPQTSAHTPELSVAEQFSHVTPLNPVASDIHSSLTASSSSSVFTSSSASSRPHGGPASGSCVLSSSSGEKKDSALSKQLVLPSVYTPVGPTRSQPRARLLTSTAALAILEEKEQKKKQEAEMKEQRKREREEKKRKKEEDKKQKAEENQYYKNHKG